MITTKSIAARAGTTWVSALFLVFFVGLSGCANSLQSGRPALYDFGPGLLAISPATAPTRAPVILGVIEATPALESLAVHYRLGYANGQQFKPYSQARWSMAPAQLIRQRLSEQLAQSRAILNPGESGLAVTFVTPASQAHWQLIEKRQHLSLPLEHIAGFEPTEVAPAPSPSNGGIKGKRPSKKDKLRAAQAAGAQSSPK